MYQSVTESIISTHQIWTMFYKHSLLKNFAITNKLWYNWNYILLTGLDLGQKKKMVKHLEHKAPKIILKTFFSSVGIYDASSVISLRVSCGAEFPATFKNHTQ